MKYSTRFGHFASKSEANHRNIPRGRKYFRFPSTADREFLQNNSRTGHNKLGNCCLINRDSCYLLPSMLYRASMLLLHKGLDRALNFNHFHSHFATVIRKQSILSLGEFYNLSDKICLTYGCVFYFSICHMRS